MVRGRGQRWGGLRPTGRAAGRGAVVVVAAASAVVVVVVVDLVVDQRDDHGSNSGWALDGM